MFSSDRNAVEVIIVSGPKAGGLPVYIVGPNHPGAILVRSVGTSRTMVGAVNPALAYTANIVSLNPIAYWPLAEASGTKAFDESGNSPSGERDGTYTNVVLGQTGIGDRRTSALFVPASSPRVAVHTTGLAGAFNGAVGTLLLWTKVSGAGVWTDGTTRYMAQLFADASNLVYIRKNTTNNQMQFVYVAGGTTSAVIATYSGTDWTTFAITWNRSAGANGEVKGYTNGVQTGVTQTALGTFAGTLAATNTVIGAISTAGANPWDGTIAHVAVFNTALTAQQIAMASTVVTG